MGGLGRFAVGVVGAIDAGTAFLHDLIGLIGGQSGDVGHQSARGARDAQIFIRKLVLVQQLGQVALDLLDAVDHILGRQFFGAEFEYEILGGGDRVRG